MADTPALLAMAFRVIMDQVHESLAAQGFADVRPAHGFAFQYLSLHPAATAVDLGQHLGVTKQAAVQLVDELQRRGYVERGPHPTDRRSRVIALTPRGWACVQRVVELWAAMESRWADLIGADRLDLLRDDLARLIADGAGGQPVALRPVW
ncbi:MarR family winged helix-turn-helix transcriptional regulator [Actinokineospora iranica]|uniref:DNA-binding transcriptional regulator, MarR family n=1 Tax=Actinokineospora iranica TaxID=1271860 RepID=A0A1G6KAD0_9PSEU|nr:MarR family winged helix-turn-helix transcriptional regulator [Actinokineospora iranica]SDC27771.1 DNA-binding transcriptional regulator, MarR family [Actinokineospora iranica]